MNEINASKLSNPELRKMRDEPGCYKWWAKKKQLEELLNKFSPKITFEDIKDELEIENDYYCIYVGISKSSIRKRLNTHINGVIFDSTLRKTIASVLEYYENSEEKTNNFIDKLKITYFYEARDKVEQDETDLIKAKFRILNLSKNEYEKTKGKNYGIKKQLTIFRKQAEAKVPLVFNKTTKNQSAED